MSVVAKAVVTEENGEISCSVEETNRIRSLLGLKPLRGYNTDPNSQGGPHTDTSTAHEKEVEAVQNFKLKKDMETR